MDIKTHSRRKFLAFAAASPLAAVSPLLAQQVEGFFVNSPKDILDVRDMETLAGRKIAPPHWGYLQTGVDDDLTLKANEAAYRKLAIRPRRLQGSVTVDTKVNIFGVTWDSPIHLCPVASHKMFHKEGEDGTARAAKAKKTLMVLSTDTMTPLPEVAKELGQPPWFQMYAPGEWSDVEKMTHEIEDAGCPVLVLTIDNMGGRNRETEARTVRRDARACTACHGADWKRPPAVFAYRGAPMGIFNWDFVDRLHKLTRMKLVLKGIVRREDAALAVAHGMDGIVVSNHGGRVAEENRGTIEALPEVLEGADRKIPVFIDGGVRRGTDIFKALALGARSVGIGRPYIWGLGAFGQPGVERVIDILNAELAMIMRQCGTKSLAEINRSFVV